MIRRIAVYCGASKGNDPSYVKEANELGKYMAEQGYEPCSAIYLPSSLASLTYDGSFPLLAPQ